MAKDLKFEVWGSDGRWTREKSFGYNFMSMYAPLERA